jgi:hypothetical protein
VRRVVTHTGVTDTPTKSAKTHFRQTDDRHINLYAAGIYRRAILIPTFPTLPTFGVEQSAGIVDRRPTRLSKFRRAFWTIWSGDHVINPKDLVPR